MSYIGKNPKADTLNLTPQSALPTTPSEGMLWRSDGTVRGVGLFEYKSGNWIQVDEQLGDSDTLDLQTADGCNLTYNANWYSSGSLNIQGRSDTWGAEREDLSGTGTNDFITLSTTAADLLNSNGISVIKFAPTDATAGRNSYFGRRVDLQQGWRGSNLVVEFRYKTAETSGDTTGTDWLFVARDASIPPLEIASQGTNTLTTSALAAVVAEDGTTSVYKAPAVGDAIMLTDTSNNTYLRYITVVTGTANAGGTPVITYSGTDLTLPTGTDANATGMPGIFTSLTQYLPASDDQGSSYKAQVKTDTDTKTIEFGIMHISTQTDQQIYVDNLLLSANKFLQVNTNLKPESYTRGKGAGYWLSSTGTAWSSGATYRIDWSGGTGSLPNTAGPDSPAYDQSNYLEFTTASNDSPGTATTVSVIKAKKKVNLTWTVGNDAADNETVRIYVSRGGATGALVGITQQRGDNDTSIEASANVVLEKDDYVYGYISGGSYNSGWHSIVATPVDSPAVVLESQDEIFTDWTAFTPTGTWTSNATYEGFWCRVGSNMKIWAKVTMGGAPNSSTLAVNLPSGYVIDQTVGTLFTANAYGDNNFTFGRSWMQDGGGGNVDVTGNVGYESSTSLSISASYASGGTSDSYIKEDPVSQVSPWTWASTDSLVFEATVPIQGWNANFNPLLSMPLVEIGARVENFRARGLGARKSSYNPTFATETNNTISSLGTMVNDSTGVGCRFTANQRVKVNIEFDYVSSSASQCLGIGLNSAINNPDSITDDIVARSIDAGTGAGGQVSWTGILESGDYIMPLTQNDNPDGTTYFHLNVTVEKDDGSINMAHIIKPAVCYFASEQTAGTNGGNSGTASWNQLYPNTFKGETWFIEEYNGTLGPGGTNWQFKLSPGTYEVAASAPVYRSGQCRLKMRQQDDGIEMGDGINGYTNTSSGSQTVDLYLTFTLTKAQNFAFFTFTADAHASQGLGVSATISGYTEKYLQGFIRKLK